MYYGRKSLVKPSEVRIFSLFITLLPSIYRITSYFVILFPNLEFLQTNYYNFTLIFPIFKKQAASARIFKTYHFRLYVPKVVNFVVIKKCFIISSSII